MTWFPNVLSNVSSSLPMIIPVKLSHMYLYRCQTRIGTTVIHWPIIINIDYYTVTTNIYIYCFTWTLLDLSEDMSWKKLNILKVGNSWLCNLQHEIKQSREQLTLLHIEWNRHEHEHTEWHWHQQGIIDQQTEWNRTEQETDISMEQLTL